MDQQSDIEINQIAKDIPAGLTASEIAGIIAGVLAGPGDDGRMGGETDWMQLISENLDDEHQKQLAAHLAEAAGNLEGDTRPHGERLAALRENLLIRKLDGFLVPLADEHQGEYVPKHAARLKWLTGFTGSAGIAVVLADQATLFVDGRYTLQAEKQVDGKLFQIRHLVEQSPTDWIAEILQKGARLGFDPWLHTGDGTARYRRAVAKAGAELSAEDSNPIDSVWWNQPPPPLWPITIQDVAMAGKSSSRKREEIAAELRKAGEDAAVLTQPDSIAWLANIRGGDVPYTPFVLGFAILGRDTSLNIYTDQRKLLPSVKAALEPGIRIHPRGDFEDALAALGKKNLRVRADGASTAEAILTALKDTGARLINSEDPCALPKACKNAAELSGMQEAHLADGAALCRFLAWLDREAPTGGLTEMAAADRLEEYRRECDNLQGLSFPTISGSGANGAIIHYRVTEKSDRPLEPGSLYLVDSGGQYSGGTTDVTRTVAVGTPTTEMIEHFTCVLKGHIALARAIFPEGTTGSQLDALARTPLWRAGLDYDHGTGHGVGCFLSVHEGPHRISKMPNRIAMKPGMVVSNEPGYYQAGAYGIRIENLFYVHALEKQSASKLFFGFEVLTLAPIDLNLVNSAILDDSECKWLNLYHTRVAETLTPLVDAETREWLKTATRTI
ncbi:MAG: aminopeptidase P family protein [Pseudomonadota bacterium]|nr:aminopeptidase P family protein [Pseudomonadota bacterium]